MVTTMKVQFFLGILVVLVSMATQAHAEQMTIKHTLGTTLLNGIPKRVVVLGVGPLDALDAFGIHPVGVTKFPSTPDYLQKYASDDYPSAGSLFEPDFEKIYSEKPDLILMGPRNSKHYAELSKIAPTIVYAIDNKESVWEGTKDEWRMLGKIFHVEDKVDTKIQQLDKDFNAIHDYSQKHAESALTIMNMGGNLSAFGADSRFGSIYKEFGFKEAYHSSPSAKQVHKQGEKKRFSDNDALKSGPKGRHGNLVSFEFIQEKNPDVIFVIDKDKLVNHGVSTTKDIFDNTLIRSTNAYKNHKIVYLDVNAWYVSIAGVHSTEQMVRDIKKIVKLN